MITEATGKISQGTDLRAEEMQRVIDEIMSGKAKTPEIVAFLDALNKKGETVEELTAAVSIMRKYATAIRTAQTAIVDTCGTGGDKKGTFNISTIVAFVVSGCGVTVAKHGNRSVSSSCGSADVLEQVGINIHMSSEKIEACLEQIGIAFLFAQDLHPAMKYAMPARKTLGVKTIFNLIGPLSNPAGATHQLVGVYDEKWRKPLAQVLGNLGSVHALVVHGADGLDEVTTAAKTYVAEFQQQRVKTYQIAPEEFGIRRAHPEDLIGRDAQGNAQILLDILQGKTGPQRDIVVLNAACALYVADKAPSIKEAVVLAQHSLDTRAALKKLEGLRAFSLEKQ